MKHHYFSALLVLSLAILPITFLSCNSSSGGGGVDGKIRYEAEILAGTIGYSIHIDYVDNDGNNKYTTKEIYEPDDSPKWSYSFSADDGAHLYLKAWTGRPPRGWGYGDDTLIELFINGQSAKRIVAGRPEIDGYLRIDDDGNVTFEDSHN